jgi:Tfp pilus assembly protein PilN
MRAVNLLTPDLRSASSGKGPSGPSALEAPGGIGAFILLGALALCVAALAGYVVSNNVIKDRKAELAQVRAQSAATVAQANTLKPYADFQTLAKDRAGTVQALAMARFDWEQALRDLSRAMPKEVYLSSLDGSISGGSAIRGAINSPAIELKGCTKSQPAVATLMSRMRNVEGVTRVSLAKSDKDSGAVGAGGVGSGTVNPCGKGAPPSFEIVIFFERSKVAQVLTGVTGAVDPAAPVAAATPAAGAKIQPGAATPAPTTPPTAAVTGGAK